MAPHNTALHTNLDVDYVIVYRFHETGEVKDWLFGVRAAQPDRETHNILTSQSLTEAERLRIVYGMIANPPEEGGAGITPKFGACENVEAIFPLHDHAYNKEWIKKWSTVTFLKVEDLDEIRNRLGEKIAYYFAFTQSYFSFLLAPAAFGFSCWVLLGHFSPVYAVINGLWCVVFIEYWKRQEVDLGVRWGVKGVSAIQEKRRDFKHEKEVEDPITGETVQVFPATKRLTRQLLQIPFAIIASVALGTIIATCFGIEIFLSEVYNGPFKSYLSAMTSKIFILNFITSYLPIFLTAFVYVPFGALIVPYLDVFSLTAKPFADNDKQLETPSTSSFVINPERLRKQVIYFTVTAQIVNFAMETIVPVVKRRAFSKYQDMKTERAAKREELHPMQAPKTRQRRQSSLPEYEMKPN
ncbi:MAG: hypothetical protein OHK93_004137 [Ramalina farinacea]|uniref:Anoctamin n=1 Tax=Ramalina farinacea TaxID=258253 RepID=A0AA43QJQ7_9LECA|nr:hypothetical protein [Ramalina farinacea]